MFKFINATFLALLICLGSHGQVNVSKYKQLKRGTFYYYGATSADKYIIIRNESIQKEINVASKDTSVWKIEWQNDCNFTLRFVRSSKKMSDEQREFYYSHVNVISIINMTDRYYSFKIGLDSINSQYSKIDTVWLKKS